MALVRINKFLADREVGSRRKVEDLILAGRVVINDKKAELFDKIDPEKDEVFLDNRRLRYERTETKLLAFYKPEGVVCSKNGEGFEKTIFDYVDGRWISIGRLDVNSRGLLLFTNNGELANKAMHPSYQIERKYLVKVFGEMADGVIDSINAGVEEDGVLYKFDEFSLVSSNGMEHYFSIKIKEGKNREVRRVFEANGFRINKLKRVSYGNINLKDLRAGQTREVSDRELWEFLRLLEKTDGQRKTTRPRTGKAGATKERSDKSFKQQNAFHQKSSRVDSELVHDGRSRRDRD